jgi:transcriptional regulator with XRE-family HTH domain
MQDSDIERARLGERLKQAREYLDLSQDEVAKRLGLARAAVSLIESGQREVKALELKKFADIYQRPASYFTGEIEVAAALPEDVEHLARTASKLSQQDRRELARFAEFLNSRATQEDERGE